METSNSQTIRVMVVDDHQVVRQGLVALINTEPGLMTVAEASDGQQAVEMFRQYQPDITLMDLRLPVMGGVDATTVIRQ